MFLKQVRSFDFLVNNHHCLTALRTKANAVPLVLKAHSCLSFLLSLTKFCLLRFYQPNLSCLGTFGCAHLLFQNVFAPYLHMLNTLFPWDLSLNVITLQKPPLTFSSKQPFSVCLLHVLFSPPHSTFRVGYFFPVFIGIDLSFSLLKVGSVKQKPSLFFSIKKYEIRERPVELYAS